MNDTFGFTSPDDRDRLAELGTLAGGLVHELKNPLGVMLLNAELLLNQAGEIAPDQAQRERLEKRLRRIVDSGRSLQAIVESFLSFARPGRPDPDAVDINALLRQLVEEQADLDERAGVKVTLHLDDTLALVPADQLHLRSIFLNVLKNAREALREKAGERKLLIITRAGTQQARVVIANNGPPLPPAVAAHLFEPFTSAKEGGTGLGLAIVRRLVEMHHGTVTASSDEHQGVSFTFEFPTPLGPASQRTQLPIPEAEATVREDRPASGVRRPASTAEDRSPASVRLPKKPKKLRTPDAGRRTPDA
jgi:signal transduction histidine kinase